MEGQNVTQRGSLAKRERQTSMQKGRRTATASSTHSLHCCCFSPRRRSLSWIALAIIYLPFKWKMEHMPTHGKHTSVHKDGKTEMGEITDKSHEGISQCINYQSFHPCQEEVSRKDGRVQGLEPTVRSRRDWKGTKEGGPIAQRESF